MSHIVLLGDSIFDNAAYVKGGPDVIGQLREKLAPGWQATLLAVDGSVTADVRRQLERMPLDATHLVVSAGGNDALHQSGMVNESASSTAEVLNRLADVGQRFEQGYEAMLRAVLAHHLPAAVCTIYYPNFSDPVVQRITTAALTIFNEVIIRRAFVAGLPLIDLRLVCSEAADYANEIEPSVAGGAKIAATIRQLVREHDFQRGRTEVFK